MPTVLYIYCIFFIDVVNDGNRLTVFITDFVQKNFLLSKVFVPHLYSCCLFLTTGFTGSSGPVGDPGAAGIAGSSGLRGSSGTAGPPGSPGSTGIPGLGGLMGNTGMQGRDGNQGFTGQPGAGLPGEDIRQRKRYLISVLCYVMLC